MSAPVRLGLLAAAVLGASLSAQMSADLVEKRAFDAAVEAAAAWFSKYL